MSPIALRSLSNLIGHVGRNILNEDFQKNKYEDIYIYNKNSPINADSMRRRGYSITEKNAVVSFTIQECFSESKRKIVNISSTLFVRRIWNIY